MLLNHSSDAQFSEFLSQLETEDILMLQLIESLSDEQFADAYAKAHNLNDQPPAFKRLS